jgi:hypothetical protein
MSFTGTLSELALCDLVEITALGGKTGVLDVTHPDGSPAGRLAFREGALVSASCGALVGERAFYALIGLREGGFVFDPDLDPGEAPAADLPTGSLLMEAMRRVDEIGRLRDALPSYGLVTLLSGDPHDSVEATVLGFLGPGQRSVGDIVAGALVEGMADEYEVLLALDRLRSREVVRLAT